MTRARAFLLVASVVGCFMPGQAQASVGWWDWLEQLSGPGPFHNGWMVDQRLYCSVQDTPSAAAQGRVTAEWIPLWVPDKADKVRKCVVNSNDVRAYFEVRGGRVTSDKQALFQDAPGELIGTVAANTLQGFYMRQVGHPALTAGAGAGLIWFTGDQLDGHAARIVVTPGVAFMPLKLSRKLEGKAGGFIVIHADAFAILGGLKAGDFNSLSTSKFDRGSEVRGSFSIAFDVLALMR